MTTVLIFPEPGNTKKIARVLLDLADKASDVEFVLWPQEGFRVPEDLALKFEGSWRNAGDPDLDHATLKAAPEVVEEPVKRKPGRPKKEAQ